MLSKLLPAIAIGAALAIPSAGASIASTSTGPMSPVFGSANATAMTSSQAKQIHAKGTYSMYYGYIGSLYLNYASYYAMISQYYDGTGNANYGGNTYYYAASQYAYVAYEYLYAAYAEVTCGVQKGC